jgi:aspartate/methionine/tyrosine aminotransferase
LNLTEPAQSEELIRQQFKQWYKRIFQFELPETLDIVYASNLNQLLLFFFMGMLDSDDAVVLADPGLPLYRNLAMMTSAKILKIPALARYDYLPNIKYLQSDYHTNTRLLFLNYPHQPTGAIADEFYYRELISFASHYNLLVVNEGSMIHFLNPTHSPVSFYNQTKKFSHFIEIYGFGLPGSDFSPAFLIGHRDIVQHVRSFNSKLAAAIDPFSLQLTHYWLDHFQELAQPFLALISQNQLMASHYLNQWQWQYHKPAAGHYLWIKVPPRYSSDGIALSLLRTANIRVIPGFIFGEYGEGYFVLNLLKSSDEFHQTLERIQNHWFPLRITKIPGRKKP